MHLPDIKTDSESSTAAAKSEENAEVLLSSIYSMGEEDVFISLSKGRKRSKINSEVDDNSAAVPSSSMVASSASLPFECKETEVGTYPGLELP